MRRLPQRPFATPRVVLAQAEHSRQRRKDVKRIQQPSLQGKRSEKTGEPV